MALPPTSRASFPATATSEVMSLRHRGFDITIQMKQGRYGANSYGYTVLHLGHILHDSGGDFGTASAADKAARQLIDDAVGMFDRSLEQLEETDA